MLRSYGTERLVFKYSLKKIYSWKSKKAYHAFLVTLTREYLESIRLLAKVKKDPLPSPHKFGRIRRCLDRLRLNGAELSENCRCQTKPWIGGFPQTAHWGTKLIRRDFLHKGLSLVLSVSLFVKSVLFGLGLKQDNGVNHNE
jgi:hypothetical protein